MLSFTLGFQNCSTKTQLNYTIGKQIYICFITANVPNYPDHEYSFFEHDESQYEEEIHKLKKNVSMLKVKIDLRNFI